MRELQSILAYAKPALMTMLAILVLAYVITTAMRWFQARRIDISARELAELAVAAAALKYAGVI